MFLFTPNSIYQSSVEKKFVEQSHTFYPRANSPALLCKVRAAGQDFRQNPWPGLQTGSVVVTSPQWSTHTHSCLPCTPSPSPSQEGGRWTEGGREGLKQGPGHMEATATCSYCTSPQLRASPQAVGYTENDAPFQAGSLSVWVRLSKERERKE